MKASDLGTASTIVKRIAEIAAERSTLARGIHSAGARCEHNGGAWVNARDEEGRQAVGRAILASLDREEAALRRRAAQISLTL